MGDAARCAARSKRSGVQCRNYGLRRPDGGNTPHCRFHGGGGELLPPGDPGHGGRPSTTFRYSRFMRSDEDREIYESARSALGTLDEEINLARTNLERFRRNCEAQAKGGIPVHVADGGKSVSVRPYAEIEADYLDLIRKLEESRKKLLQAGSVDNDDSETYREWIAVARKPDDSSSGSGSSSPPTGP
jgi:hypothetical protein